MEKMDETVVIKRRRTKRARQSSSSSSIHGGDSCNNSQSPATSSTCTTTDREDEDVANCLILLARGAVNSRSNQETRDRNPCRKFVEHTIYECKTCNRAFPSFQALGGHRASHNKKPPKSYDANNIGDRFKDQETKSHLGHEINKLVKNHECSICGSEFGSGQALGGHMRRHRSSASNYGNINKGNDGTNKLGKDSSSRYLCEKVKNHNVISLDLNLPAPSEDELYLV